MSGNSSRLDVTERSFLSQSTSATDQLDGFDDFDSEVSSTEDVASSCGAHSQPQKKSIKVGKAIKRLILPSIRSSARSPVCVSDRGSLHVRPLVGRWVSWSLSVCASSRSSVRTCIRPSVHACVRLCGRLYGDACMLVSLQASMWASVHMDACIQKHYNPYKVLAV